MLSEAKDQSMTGRLVKTQMLALIMQMGSNALRECSFRRMLGQEVSLILLHLYAFILVGI